MQQKINCFQEIMFQKKSLAMIILAFKIEYLGKFTFEAKITGFWDSNYKERWLQENIFNITAWFVPSVYLECFIYSVYLTTKSLN